MAYSKDYFKLQLAFAQKVSTIENIPLIDTVLLYTSFYKTFRIDGWDFSPTNKIWAEFSTRFNQAPEKLDATYSFYLTQLLHQAGSDKPAKFGCFSFEYLPSERATLIHFRNNDDPEPGALSKEREPTRMQELKEMFQEINRLHPQAKWVFGFSWLYNLEAYKRLFPAEYVQNSKVNTQWFQSSALWGQFLDSSGNVKKDMASSFLDRIAECNSLDELKNSFPLKVLEPRADISCFYRFYGI